MKTYVKPTLSLLSSEPTSQYTSCIVKADLELIQSITGLEITKNSFAMTEPCQHQLPIDMYCKFTSAEMGAAQAFES